MKCINNAKWWSLAALLLFVAATFQIASSHFIPGAVFFGAASCFTAAAGKYRLERGSLMRKPDRTRRKAPVVIDTHNGLGGTNAVKAGQTVPGICRAGHEIQGGDA